MIKATFSSKTGTTTTADIEEIISPGKTGKARVGYFGTVTNGN